MARDFAHKPRQPEGSHIPRWVWYFTSIAAIGFVGFLYFLSQVPEESGGAQAVREQLTMALSESEPEEPVVKEEPPKHETIEDIKDKAETLKKAFQFYELLENDEVSIDLPGDQPKADDSTESGGASPLVTQPTAQAKSWIIQVASFSNVADADRVRAQLILNGLPNTEIVSVEVAGKGTYHRVMVGPFDRRPNLNKAQDILAELSYQPLVKAQ
jgi:cell division protein FtsN